MSQELVLERNVEDAKNTARILYLVHGATFFFSLGLLSIIPVIINVIKRPETAGTLVHSHHTWMIWSFIYYALWVFIGWVVFATFVGIPLALVIWGVVWLWKAYRLIRGFLNLNENKPVPG